MVEGMISNIEVELRAVEDYRIVIDFVDNSYSVYYVRKVKSATIIIDNSKVDPDDEFKGNCYAEVFDIFDDKEKVLLEAINSY